jgi:hypothetical protein
MSMLLTSTSVLQDSRFNGAWSDDAAQVVSPESVELAFRMPAAIAAKVSSDGALQLVAEGDTGPYNYVRI